MLHLWSKATGHWQQGGTAYFQQGLTELPYRYGRSILAALAEGLLLLHSLVTSAEGFVGVRPLPACG